MIKAQLIKQVNCLKLNKPELWKKWGGRVVTLGIPVRKEELPISTQPTGYWPCNTDFIWPVMDTEFQEDYYPYQIYVCRHMFIAGD